MLKLTKVFSLYTVFEDSIFCPLDLKVVGNDIVGELEVTVILMLRLKCPIREFQRFVEPKVTQ